MKGETLPTSSGVTPIDERLGGLIPGRPHLITGETGSGKTAVCLAFVGAALDAGESAVMVTEDDPQDLVAQATDLGIDLRRGAASGRFTMVRYQRDFVARLSRTLSFASPFEELAGLLGSEMPNRVVVDSVIPLLEGGAASGAGVAALAEFLERMGATALVTYAGDLRDYHDRRLHSLVRSCAAIVHLSSYGQAIGRMDVVKARWRLKSDAPSFFAIRRGCGVVPLDDSGRDASVPPPFRRQISLFEGDAGLPDDLLAALEGEYAVSSHGRVSSSASHAIPVDAGAVLIVARWDMLGDASMLLQRIRHVGNHTPVVVVTRGDIRSRDRARALLSGFDDVVTDVVAPTEFIARVSAVVRRGRSATVPVAMLDGAIEEAPGIAEALGIADAPMAASTAIDSERFRAAVEQALDRDGSVFSVVLYTPDPAELEALSSLVARTMRTSTGDVAGVVGDRLAVYMPDTRRADIAPFVRRVADAWRRSGRHEMRVVQLAYPADDERLRAESRLWASTVQTTTAK